MCVCVCGCVWGGVCVGVCVCVRGRGEGVVAVDFTNF